MIDLIIISDAKTKAHHNLTLQAIATAVKSGLPEGSKIIVVEKQTIRSYQHAETIYQQGEFNYNRYCNEGADQGTNPAIAFCNNDLIFYKGWAQGCLWGLTGHQVGSVSPWCQNSHPGLWKDHGIAQGWIGYDIRKHFAGWCFLMDRNIWGAIGRLPEHVAFWYSDNATVDALKRHRVKHGLIRNARVDHLESRTLKSMADVDKHRLTWGQKGRYENKGD